MTVPWDLAILDEAHRLRNVYKEAKIAVAIRSALETAPKMLLTATPLQNSLSELYGLVSFIDDSAFGDSRTFARKYSRAGEDGDRFEELKSRLEPLCHRTLRRQVVEYVSYTERRPLTQEFSPSEEEQVLYDLVSEYLRREELAALPYAQRALITLVLRKLLASSTFAIAGALDTMVRRLTKELREGEALLEAEAATVTESVHDGGDQDLAEALVEEQLDGALSADDLEELSEPEPAPVPPTRAQLAFIAAEISELEAFRDLAQLITENAKGEALLTALRTAFDRAATLGSSRKAVIFTESRRTQDYLIRLLSENGYEGRIVRFSGTNNDPAASDIYREWRQRHAGSDRVTGSRAVDIRAALADEFRTSAEIMIATEAAAEGTTSSSARSSSTTTCRGTRSVSSSASAAATATGRRTTCSSSTSSTATTRPTSASTSCSQRSSASSRAYSERATRCWERSRVAWTSSGASARFTSAAARARR